MGYAQYNLPDGREAGYAVEASCDQPGCTRTINRGLDCLCGDSPDGHRDPDEPGCGRYYCETHLYDDSHTCPNPKCPEWDPDENETCQLAQGHERPHHSESETWGGRHDRAQYS